MTTLGDLPDDFATTVTVAQRVATHILARRRFEVTGRFGLRVAPTGIATPQFGDDEEVLRISGADLVHEHRTPEGARTRLVALHGSSLRDLAAVAGADLDAPFSAGDDTPPTGDLDAPLQVDAEALAGLTTWYRLGAEVLDRVLRSHADASPSVVQLWPEHFDLGVDLAVGGSRANLGASPGDGGHPTPYLYLGPWEADRPGDPDYWNASFGAVIGYEALAGADDPVALGAEFLERGLGMLGDG